MKKIFLILISIFLVSCASSRLESKFSPVYVTNTSKFALLAPVEMDGMIDSVQRMTAKFGTQSFDFDVYVISDKTQLSMTIFNEFGTTMGSLFYDGTSLDFDSAVFPKNLKAEYIVADFQFCLYEAESVKTALEKIGVDFETVFTDGISGTKYETRTLTKNGNPVSKITKTYSVMEDGSVKLQSIFYDNILRGYSYTLTGEAE
ncbi:DUF3261 domain-containing protein [Treponema sp.]|uniref:DUF3261 domain-containing protein n=1 Tax=Treponema sp. TaxID=166 RepID=UPI00388D2EDF